jgi:protein TonB
VRLHTSSGSSLLDDAAIAAVNKWRFVPARQGGNPVAAWVQVPVAFKLN